MKTRKEEANLLITVSVYKEAAIAMRRRLSEAKSPELRRELLRTISWYEERCEGSHTWKR